MADKDIKFIQEQPSGKLTEITVPSSAGKFIKFGAGGSLESGDVVSAYVVKTSAFTAEAGQKYSCDTEVASFTVTLPASPVAGNEIVLLDNSRTWDTNNLTVNPNGKKISGVVENLVCDVGGATILLVYTPDATTPANDTWSVTLVSGGVYDSGDWLTLAPPAASQPEAEAGTSTELRSWSPERVKQAISANAPEPEFPTPSNSLTLLADASDAVTGYGLTAIPDNWRDGVPTLKGLSIGQGVTSIGSYAFSYCSGFTGSLTIGNSVTTIGNYAFSDCSGFTGSLTIPNSVTSIGNNAFYYCSGFTGSLTIPNSVTSIGNNAFQYCSRFTGSLTIPNSVTSIGGEAFYSCSGFTGSLTIPNSVTSIGGDAFSDCYGFTGSLTIPNSVTSIGGGAFSDCYGFTGSLTIPNSVTSIGGYAFSDCYGFTGSLTIPNSVTSIGGGAFYSCSGFTGSLTIGNSVTTIESHAFSDCYGLTNVNCHTTKTILDGSRVLSGTSVTTIHALVSDGTWTEGSGQTIGGKSGIEVIKDLV